MTKPTRTTEATRFETIVAWLDRQGELLSRVGSMSDRLSSLVGADDADGIMQLLDERQDLIDEITRLNGVLAPLREDWSGRTGHLSEPERDDVGRRLDLVSRLAEGVIEQDLAGRRRLEQRRDEIADELASLSNSRPAIAAYGGASDAAAPMFQDRQA